MKYVNRIREYFNRSDKPVFSIHELRVLGIPYSYAKMLLSLMVRRGEIVRVRKGWYTFHRDPVVFIFTLPPTTAYYGLGFAAYLHGAWSQVPNPEILTYVAPRKIRVGVHSFLGVNIIVRRISRRLFNDYMLYRYENWLLPVSTPEKTLLDIIYYNYPFQDEIVDDLINKISILKIRNLLKELPYPKRIKEKISKMLK
ncbi:MAG: hypothetical protein DRJ32_06455 [Thermoprotei archaeon]|nr:MAG: hypothetical protein DRJ32_06455 [Thermoprotei archaeon]